jgi:hypothetical protein
MSCEFKHCLFAMLLLLSQLPEPAINPGLQVRLFPGYLHVWRTGE